MVRRKSKVDGVLWLNKNFMIMKFLSVLCIKYTMAVWGDEVKCMTVKCMVGCMSVKCMVGCMSVGCIVWCQLSMSSVSSCIVSVNVLYHSIYSVRSMHHIHTSDRYVRSIRQVHVSYVDQCRVSVTTLGTNDNVSFSQCQISYIS